MKKYMHFLIFFLTICISAPILYAGEEFILKSPIFCLNLNDSDLVYQAIKNRTYNLVIKDPTIKCLDSRIYESPGTIYGFKTDKPSEVIKRYEFPEFGYSIDVHKLTVTSGEIIYIWVWV